MKVTAIEMAVRRSWEANPGQMCGKMKLTGDAAEVQLLLTPEHCQKIMEVVADALVVVAQDAANLLREDCLSIMDKSAAQVLLEEAK